MDVRIVVDEGDPDDVSSLHRWLAAEDDLRGRIRAVRRPIADTEMGGAIEALSVAVGTGGAGTVLAASLSTWLRTRKTAVKLRVETDKRTVVLEVTTVDEVLPLIERLLTGDDADD